MLLCTELSSAPSAPKGDGQQLFEGLQDPLLPLAPLLLATLPSVLVLKPTQLPGIHSVRAHGTWRLTGQGAQRVGNTPETLPFPPHRCIDNPCGQMLTGANHSFRGPPHRTSRFSSSLFTLGTVVWGDSSLDWMVKELSFRGSF